MPLPIVLHPEVANFLCQASNKGVDTSFRENVWQCLDKLRQQRFDSGLRVKKLQGIDKRIWEARINSGSRLIFTYYKSKNPQTRQPETYIAVQDICIAHDDVIRNAKNIRNRTLDAQWLDAVEIESNDLDNPEQKYNVQLAELEDLEITDNFDDFSDELLGNICWKVVTSIEEWERAILNQEIDLPIKVTPEEYDIINLYGNVLLSGSAGTGKTTVGIYRLLTSLQYLETGKRLYVAYNPLLVNHAQESFTRLINNQESSSVNLFEFSTIKNLCWEILNQAGYEFNLLDEIDFLRFDNLYHSSERQRYPATLVWDEIRSIIKGAQLNPESELLSLQQYQELGKNRSNIFEKQQRETIYKFADAYQKKLQRNQCFDEIDLARKALNIIKQNNHTFNKYQMIVCDEVQDLTELQLELLMQLLAPNGQMFFAGDIHQMISPSGFRWEDLRRRFYDRHQEYHESKLLYNFRSLSFLVHFSNQVLKLKSRLLEKKACQNKPVFTSTIQLINASDNLLLSTLKKLNAGDAILVKTESEKDSLRLQFQSSLVFTIEEAKGLEFDTVFLVNFPHNHQQLWEQIFENTRPLQDKEIPRLTLELNLLYVAITRARRCLYIWESNHQLLWQQKEFLDLLTVVDAETVASDRILEDDNWLERGEYYFKVEFYQQAAECFEKAGDLLRHKEATAYLYQKQAKYLEAAKLFAELNNWQKAAELFERIKRWDIAAHFWNKVGDLNRYENCHLYYLAEKENYHEAARGREKRQEFKLAAPLYEKALLWELAAKCWHQIQEKTKAEICQARFLEIEKEWALAGEKWEKLRLFEDAERCWNNSDNERKKAEYRARKLEKLSQWQLAAQEYKKAGMLNNAYKCAGLYFEEIEDWEKAAKSYKLAGILDKEKECKRKGAQVYYQQGLVYKKQREYDKAASSFELVLKLDSNHREAHYQRGLIYLELGLKDMETYYIISNQQNLQSRSKELLQLCNELSEYIQNHGT